MTFRGQVALVTGAASGMGRLAATRLAAAGTDVVALDVDEDGLARTARHAPMVHPVACDVADAEAVVEAVGEAVERFGPLDRVVSAAAIARSGRLVRQAPTEVARILAVDLQGSVNVLLATVPAMVERGSGDVVQFASLAGWLPSLGIGAYSAAKAGVASFTETLWRENRDCGVRFVCVCPPVVDTPLLDTIGDDAPLGLTRAPRLAPEVVLDAVDDALDDGRFWCFPGRGTTLLWRLRLLAPARFAAWMDRFEG